MSANPRDIPTMRMVVGSTSERYNPTVDISYGLIRYNTTDNNVEAYAKDGWVNLQGGGVGSDASLSSIVEYTDNSGITFLSDVSVNGVLNSTDGSFSGNLYSASGIIGGAGGWILGANGSSNYTFTGSGLTGSEANPTLNLFRGNKYIFINNTGGHPFQISNSDNTAYGSGVTNNGGAGGSTITFEVPYDAPKTLKYICTAHSGAMNGVINIHGGGSAVDASFQSDVTIGGNLYVDGSFNFGEVIKNITTVNNELLISTQVDISNHGTGPALSVTQHGDGAADNLVLLHAGTDGSAVEVKGDGRSIFYKDVSINSQLIVPDASFNTIAPIDGSLVVMGDISVNGQIFSSGGKNIQLLKVFDDVSATSDINPSTTTPWTSQQTLSFDANSIIFHNIKTSGYVTTGGGFTWPLGGHQWVLRRGKDSNNLGWNNDSSSNILRHTFNRQGDHEHETFSFIEEITTDVSYSYWQCDFSGGGARNNNDDKITWTITNISSSTSFNNTGGGGGSGGGGSGGSGGNEFVFRQTTANSTTSVGTTNTPYTITGDYFDASINLTSNSQYVVIHFHLFGEWNHSSNWDQGVVLQKKIGNGSWTLLSNWGDGDRPARNSIFPGDGTTGDILSTPEILNFVYVDTPGTTGEISYRPALVTSESNRTFYLNRTVGDSNTKHYERGVSTFTLEVKD